MRGISKFAVLAILVATTAMAEDPAPVKKVDATDEMIINARGGNLAQLFPFGVPSIVIASRGPTKDDDDVVFGYGTFLLRVHHKTITNCFFTNDWKGTIRGVRIGDSREAVVKILGKPRIVVKNKEGVETDYGYDLKSPDAILYTNFDADGKVKRVQIGAPEKPKVN